MKRLFSILCLLSSVSGFCQSTATTVKAAIATNLPDNTTKVISPNLLRTSLNTMVDYIDTKRSSQWVNTSSGIGYTGNVSTNGLVDIGRNLKIQGVSPELTFNPTGGPTVAAVTADNLGNVNFGNSGITVVTLGSLNGNVGIGTGSPSAKLQVNGDIKVGSSGNMTLGKGNSSVNTNTGFGVNVLSATTIGADNTAIGHESMKANQNGYWNTAIGLGSLKTGVNASNNVAVGYNALMSSISGGNNTAVGAYALISNATGLWNTAVGRNALGASKGSSNTGVGYEAGGSISSGINNTLVGTSTGGGLASGSNNTIIGAGVGGLTENLSNNIIIADGQGNRRINVDAVGNVGIGTNTPSAKLDVVGTSNLNGSVLVGGTARFNNNMYQFWIDKDGASQKMLGMDVSGNFNIGDSQNYMGYGNNQYVTNSNHIFSTNSTEKVRINKDGNMGIGTNNPTAKLEVNGDIKFNGGKSLVSTIQNLKYTKTFNKPMNYFPDSIVVLQAEHQVVSPEMVVMKSTNGIMMLPYKINSSTKRVVVYFNKDKAYEGSFTIF